MIGIEFVPRIGNPYCYVFYDDKENKKKNIGYIMGTHLSDKLAYIWFVFVRERYRGKGHGKMMVKFLQGVVPNDTIVTPVIEDFKGFGAIKTQVGGSTKDGVEMLKKCGFIRKEGDYVWERQS